MKQKKPTKRVLIISGIIVSIMILLFLVFYLSVVLPQLSDISLENRGLPALASDQETTEICSKYQNSSVSELWNIASQYKSQKNYKVSYNICKILLPQVLNDKNNLTMLALTYSNIGDCYRMAGNTKAACAYSDLAIKMIPKEASEADFYYTQYKAACAYVDDSINNNFKKSQKVVDQFKYVSQLSISSSEWKDNYTLMNDNTYNYLILFYGMSPQIYDYNEVIKYSKQQLENGDSHTGRYYTIALAYLRLGDTEEAYEYWSKMKKTNRILEDFAIGAYYFTLKGDLLRAKYYMNLLELLCISQNTKEAYYYTSTLYYKKDGNITKAKEFLTKLKDNNNYKVYDINFIKLEKELGMNFDDVRAQLAQKYEEYSKISLELGGKSWEDGLKEIS